MIGSGTLSGLPQSGSSCFAHCALFSAWTIDMTDSLQFSAEAEFDSSIATDTVETVQAGQCHYCPKGGTHMLQNRGEEPLVFFAVVTEQ